ncbi:hypothetical protein FOA43_002543 [Brettanomyces nanus]|uniref:E3 ubiquitin-protein ligase n=1 Tax=Eeniella nana TaxID=13502 RepID=A0A875S2Q3_EENNA|nr:uncharacterized protein FOA43_002543 [Brettanomyces nanus]QPG75193.1 hypothetical protein FOA43_002543 [Brettanomyces nanus]
MNEQRESSKALLREYLLELPQKELFKFTPDVKEQFRHTIDTFMLLSSGDMASQDNNHYHVSRPCAREFLKGETCYRCLTCGYDETCALCSYCFQPERHIGHQVHRSIIQRDNAGCCDCGDPEAYPDSRCDYYHAVGMDGDSSPIDSLTNATNDFIDNFSDILSVLVDYIIDVKSQAVPCLVAPRNPEEIIRFSESSSLSSEIYGGEDVNSNCYALVLYNDQLHQFRDSVQRVRFATGKVVEFAEMVVLRCEKEGYAMVMISEDVTLLLKRQTVLSSTGLTACIRSTRDVFREDMCDEIITWMLDLSKSAIIENSIDLRNSFARVLMCRHLSGCASRPISVAKDGILLSPTELEYIPFQDEYRPPDLTWDIPMDIKQECEYEDLALVLPNSDGSYKFSASRMQFMLFYDIRMCRISRQKLHDTFVTMVVNNLRYKMLMTAQFLDIYETLLTLFLSFDREPECSILPILTTQLFTCPSSCVSILRHGDEYKMIRSVDNYLRLGSTNDSNAYNEEGLLCTALKNRKWGHVFMDLNYLITRNPDPQCIVYFFQTFPKIVHLASLLQSRPVLKREATKHVEYEFTDYGIFFNASSVIAHFAESIGKVFNRLDEQQLILPDGTFVSDMLYGPLINRMVEITFGNPPNTSDEATGKVITDREDAVVISEEILDDGSVRRYVDFDVLSGRVSFLHPLQAALAWVLETDRSVNSPERVKRVLDMIDTITCEKVAHSVRGDGVKAVFDFTLRTLVLLSQIKVGLWVRNGLSVRTQMNIYKYSGLRECGFMRNLFLAQVLCAFSPPEDGMKTLIRRWGIDEWCRGAYKECEYGPQHSPEMVEEFVLFLINLLTEDFHLHKRPATEILDMVIERELIHALCFKPLNYSQLTAEIPEYMCAEKRFFIAFEDCAEEVPNSHMETKELKFYRLKEKYFSDVDPFYVYYTSNKREDCIRMLKERARKASNNPKMPLDRVVLPPKKIDWTDSPFAQVVNITCSNAFLNFIQKTIYFCTHPEVGGTTKPESSCDTDSLLSLTLHLIQIAVSQQNRQRFITDYLYSSPLPAMLFSMLTDDRYGVFVPTLRAILHVFCHQAGLTEEQVRSAIPGYSEDLVLLGSRDNALAVHEKKKRLAKKKRERILAKIKKQQQKFAENCKKSKDMNMDMDLDEEGDLDGSNAAYLTHIHDNSDDDDVHTWRFPEERCILCQMASQGSDEPFGIFSYVAPSNEFRYVPCDDNYWFYKAFSGPSSLDTTCQENDSSQGQHLHSYLSGIEEKAVIGPGFPNSETCYSDNQSSVTSCCHGMHFSCYVNYIRSIRSRQVSQITRTMPEDLQRLEFLCPLCKSVNNMFVPIVYSCSDGKFHEEFAHPITLDQMKRFFEPSFDWQIRTEMSGELAANRLQCVKQELVNTVKSNVKPGHWFVNDSTNTVNTKSKTFVALNQAIGSMSILTSPFDGINALISSTIESLEISLRGVDYSKGSIKMRSADLPLVCSQLSGQAVTTLRVWCQLRDLIRCTETAASTSGRYGSDGIANGDGAALTYPRRLLGLLRNVCVEEDLLYDGESYFKLLVGAEGLDCLGLSFQILVGLCYCRHVLQSILKVMTVLQRNGSKLDGESMQDVADITFTGNSNKLCKEFSSFLGPGSPFVQPEVCNILYSMLVRLVTPFLRRCLIYSYIKFGNFRLDLLPSMEKESGELECNRICKFLGLPSLVQVVDELSETMFSAVTGENRLKIYDSKIPYPGPIELIKLPEKLNTFFTQVCGRIEKNWQPVDPAICLYCGVVLDMQSSNYGDRYGSCNMHMDWECIDSDGYGIFFVPRNNCILLLGKKKGTFIESPYLDIHGECENDSKKSHDLHLSPRKYEELARTVWLEHNIQNRISRQMESQVDIGGWLTL